MHRDAFGFFLPALLVVALQLPMSLARADLGFHHRVWTLGQLQPPVAPGAKEAKLASSRFTLVPFYQQQISKDPVVLVRARFELVNPGAARRLGVTLIERRGSLFTSRIPADEVGSGDGNTIERGRLLKRATIAALAVAVDGKPAQIRSERAKKRRLRERHSFDVDMPAGGKTIVHLTAVIHSGFRDRWSDGTCWKGFFVTYAPHRKPGWGKPVGPVELRTRAGGFSFERTLKGRATRWKRRLKLGNFNNPPCHDDCGSFNLNRVLHASSTRQAKPLPHVAALALDGDPTTAWIDADKAGGVGAWLQVPTRTRSYYNVVSDLVPGRMRRVRGVTVQAGAHLPGTARVKKLRVACLGKRCKTCNPEGAAKVDCDGKPRVLGVFSLPDDSKTASGQTMSRWRRSRRSTNRGLSGRRQ
jgi:hypothetical protein